MDLPHDYDSLPILRILGSCPSGWEYCPVYYMRTLVTFNHHDDLASGELLYELYKIVDDIMDLVRENLAVDNQIVYVGYKSVSADITLILNGVPEGQKMDDIQLDYFSDVTVRFLEGSTDDTIKVLHLDITEQSIAGRRSRLLQSGSLQLEGKILGAQTTLFAADNFRDELEDTFQSDQEVLLERLIVDGLRPGDITEEGRIEYFHDITSVGGDITVDEVAEDIVNSKPGSGLNSPNVDVNVNAPDSSDIMGYIIPVVVVVVVLGVVLCFLRRYCNRRREKRDSKDKKDLRDERETLDGHATPSYIRPRLPEGPLDSEKTPMQRSADERTALDGIPEDNNGDRISVSRSKSFDEGSLYFTGVQEPPTPKRTPRPPAKRGVGRTKSFDDASSEYAPTTPARMGTKRGVGRTKSFDEELSEYATGGNTPRQSPSPSGRGNFGPPVTPGGRGAPGRAKSLFLPQTPVGRGQPGGDNMNRSFVSPGHGPSQPPQGSIHHTPGRGPPARSYSAQSPGGRGNFGPPVTPGRGPLPGQGGAPGRAKSFDSSMEFLPGTPGGRGQPGGGHMNRSFVSPGRGPFQPPQGSVHHTPGRGPPARSYSAQLPGGRGNFGPPVTPGRGPPPGRGGAPTRAKSCGSGRGQPPSPGPQGRGGRGAPQRFYSAQPPAGRGFACESGPPPPSVGPSRPFGQTRSFDDAGIADTKDEGGGNDAGTADTKDKEAGGNGPVTPEKNSAKKNDSSSAEADSEEESDSSSDGESSASSL
jgi:hypothetical protein